MKLSRLALALLLVLVGLAIGLFSPVRAKPPRPAPDPTAGAAGTADYAAAFAQELKKVGQITPEQFARRYDARAGYLPKITWDPTTAKFFDQLGMDPNRPGATVRFKGQQAERMRQFWQAQQQNKGGKQPLEEPTRPAKGLYDFRLNADEMARFKANGFVVSERMGAASCVEMFYRIYERDLPVYVSADAVLHAWHHSYDAMLEQLEQAYLAPALDDILAGMASQVPEADRQYGRGALADGVRDADYFLAVARSLLNARAVTTHLDQDDRVAQTLRACESLRMQTFPLFGRERMVDFSQFKPRGHYEKSEQLRRYFQAMMWCGRIDLRVAGSPGTSSARELGAALVLDDLLRRAGKFEPWQQFDRVIQTFVGQADSMTFAQLEGVLGQAKVRSPADVKDLATLAGLQKEIEASEAGRQHITGDVYRAGEPLPRSFTVLGQRFVIDSWVSSKVVSDEVLWDGHEVPRRIPSCLDVAFAVLANDQAVPEVVARINSTAGRQFRDGLPYQHNLAAARQVVDRLDGSAWGENLHMHWLGSLRELSRPTTEANYPECMRTRAWAMKSLNTQMASWTELRHDTILYAKQSYSRVLCVYPAGYVEPVPAFWDRLQQMAACGAGLLEKTPYPPDLKHLQTTQAGFLRTFAARMETLKGIAEKELAQKELTKEEAEFLQNLVQVQVGCGGPPDFTGWYPGLYYGPREECTRWGALVVDVHTDPPSEGDPGCVLHQAVGNVDLLVVAIDSGKDRIVYAGPVLSHYELEMPGVSRKSDAEWRKDLKGRRAPPRPAWTRGYLVPGVNQDVGSYVEPRDGP
jgi:Protein of unknown function (DUF3160)